MNLIEALANTPLTWTLTPSTQDLGGPNHQRATMLLTVVPQPGAAAITMHFPWFYALTPVQMLVVLMRKHLKDNAQLREYLNSRGSRPVALAVNAEDVESIGWSMHTGLRKLADTQQSVITWNALHKLHADDCAAVWAAARKAVADAFAGAQPPTLRNLASTLKFAVTEALEQRSRMDVRNAQGLPDRRSELQEYALLTMRAGVALTDIDEWMHGWLGYVVKDLEPEAADA